jgi:hypothetical protein
MIVCRRPVLLFDADLAGAAACAALICLGYFAGVQGLSADWATLQALRARVVAADRACQAARIRLIEEGRAAAALRAAIDSRAGEVPGPEALSAFLGRAGMLAARSGLTVQQVAPQPTQPEGDYLVCEVRMSGTGRSLDFIRFLEQLVRHDPYYIVHSFKISGRGDQEPTCALSWTLRLYMLPAADRPAAVSRANPSAAPALERN